ncbi:MAG: post-transcriptional regulator [Bacilli bacterium]|nr:post-transcriptional regulator [Bacilli bacterium]
MNQDIKFNTITDLYNRIYPALRSMRRELNKKGLKFVHEEDIWNFLRIYKWTSSSNLDLGSMVNDIFNIDIPELEAFIRNNFANYLENLENGAQNE